MNYAKQIKAQSNNLTWAEQIKSGKQPHPSQINTSLEYTEDSINVPQDNYTNNMLTSSNLKSLAIPYQVNQPTNLLLQNSNFVLISLFGVNKYLTSNIKNITCFLQRIATFIKQRPLYNRNTKDIP